MTESNEKETPGAALPEAEATPEAVEAAVSRASDESLLAEPVLIPEFLQADAQSEKTVTDEQDLKAATATSSSADIAAESTTIKSNSEAEEHGSSTAVAASAKPAATPADDELYRQRAAQTATAPYTPVAATATAHTGDENYVLVEKDHPMAGFYVQAPVEPDMRGNRLAGVLISLLATIVFAGVYSGAYALLQLLWFAPDDKFLADVLLPFFGSAQFYLPVGVFALSIILLVLIVGKAGWWAYVLGGFPIAGAVWVAAVLGYALVSGELADGFSWRALAEIGSNARLILAGIVAREVVVWFGAWIGARGRRVKLKNKQALADYEAAIAESQTA